MNAAANGAVLPPASPLADVPALALPPATSDALSLRYMPGLDVVRGLAIASVLVYHGLSADDAVYASYSSHAMVDLRIFLKMGAMGVHLFFVLSGFLITGILIESRRTPDYYRNFYLRRALRIVPAYLLMLVVLKLTHSITWRYVAVCLLYFCNMSAMLGAQPEYGPFWSLSVEEQFYLTWPLVVRKVSLRALAIISATLIVGTPVLRFALLYGPAALHDIHYKTWVLVDFFAAGAVLAIAVRSPEFRPRLPGFLAPLGLGGLVLLAAMRLAPVPSNQVPQRAWYAVELEPWLLLCTALVLWAFLRPQIAAGIFARPLIFLANISYGLYLCHTFIFHVVDDHWPVLPGPSVGMFPRMLLRFVVEAALAIAVATISRRTFEEFFLRRKPKHTSATQPPNTVSGIT